MSDMPHISGAENQQPPTRRTALRRLAGASVAAYMVPEFIFMGAARAGGSKPSGPTPLAPLPEVETPEVESPKPVSVASERSEEERDDEAGESCATPSTRRLDHIRISRSDLSRAQDAIRAGSAQPLENIWGGFTSNYDGRVIGVEFIGQPNHTRYRFRAISATGRLETVTISAQTGSIEKIVGCG